MAAATKISEIAPTKGLKDLKDIFGLAGRLFYDPNEYDLSTGSAETPLAITPAYDLPCTVDTFKMQQGDPTINHYKIIGVNGDWYTDFTAGDTTIEFTVPTKETDVLKMAYGDDAVADLTNITIGGLAMKGTGLKFREKIIKGTFCIVNKEKDQIMLISGAEVMANALYGTDNNAPFAVHFSGSIKSDDDTVNVAWLKAAA